MINAILLLFLAYLNPNAELQTTLVDTVYIESTAAFEVEVIKDKNDIERVNKLFGNELKLPESYFIDETLVIKKLNVNEDPATIKVVNTIKEKNGNYQVVYTAKENSDVQNGKTYYAIFKVKPVANKNAEINFFKADIEDPIFVNQSVNISPSPYSNVQTQAGEVIFHDFFPLDRGNSWTYIYRDNDSKKEVTSNIVSFTKGWSIFDNFFGKEGLAFKIDLNDKLMTSSKDGIRSFYNDTVNIKQTTDSFSVEAGTFNNVLIVSIPKNDEFWFRDIYARNVGLIYHEHHSSKGSFIYELKNGEVRGKSIP